MADEKETSSRRAQLVRLFEASAKIDFPTKDEVNFRLALMKAVGREFNLAEVKNLSITGPATTDTPRPQRAGRS